MKMNANNKKKPAKTTTGKIQHPAASGCGQVVQGKPSVASTDSVVGHYIR